jgi:ribosomal protein L37AE/L43A
MIKHPRIKDAEHRKFIGGLHCIVCGDNTSVEACHIRFPDLQAGKRPTGGAEKSDDIYTLPMCSECHRKQHKMSERGFWEVRNIDAVKVAQALYIVHVTTGDHGEATRIVDANRTSD